MKMGNGGNVPRVTCQGAREETASVVGKVGDDHFDGLQGKPGGRRQTCRRSLQRRTRRPHLPGYSWSSVPNSLNE
jgi:hypothetical protein